jgi:hypothetical protein
MQSFWSCYSNICLTPCNLAHKAFFHFPMCNFHPFLKIPEIKIHFFHIYTPCLLYNMHICRLHHCIPRTSRNVFKIGKWCRVSMSGLEINDPWPSIYWKHFDSALQFHLKAINGTIPSYGKEEKEFRFVSKVALEEIFTSH